MRAKDTIPRTEDLMRIIVGGMGRMANAVEKKWRPKSRARVEQDWFFIGISRGP